MEPVTLWHDLITDPEESFLVGDCLTDQTMEREGFYVATETEEETFLLTHKTRETIVRHRQRIKGRS